MTNSAPVQPTVELEITAEEIVKYLKEQLQIQEIYQTILQQRIIAKTAQERNLTLTPEEIQVEADRLRLENHLEKAADTFNWLAQQMVSPDDWEAGIISKLLRKKLAESLFVDEVENFFGQNRLNFEQVLLYQIIVADEKFAWELYHQIQEEEISFYLAANLYDLEEKRRHQCGYEGKLYRWSIQPEFAPTIFAAELQTVTAPLTTEQGSHLFMVEEFIPAQLTPDIQEEILEKMFSEWLTGEFTYLLLHADGKEKENTSD
ncbi:MAG: peptidylprolyl isomerase [Synechocystis sp.]|nr:peptidylprolyl isomerase [Synechocystis sp.]